VAFFYSVITEHSSEGGYHIIKALTALSSVAALFTHLLLHPPLTVQIPSALPDSGEEATTVPLPTATWPTGWRNVASSASHYKDIRLQQIQITTHATIAYVSGSVLHVQKKGRAQDVWVKVLQLAAQPVNDNDWVYAVPVDSSGQFHEWIQLPFGSGHYELAVAPALATAQTSLHVRFATRLQVLTPRFDLVDVKADDNRQLGQLSSAWANWLSPSVRTLAQSITAHAVTPLDKVRAVYNWEAAHIAYNFAELNNQEDYHWSTAQETLTTQSGICVDYSNVADALLRAVNIPTQMLIGYASDAGAAVADNGNLGHSWNRSYVAGHWVYFDPTWSREYLSPTEYFLQNKWFNPSAAVMKRTHRVAAIATR